MEAEPGLRATIGPEGLSSDVVATRLLADGTVIGLCLDAQARRIDEITWLPGRTLSCRAIRLDAPVPEFPAAVSLADDVLLLADNEDGDLRLVDLQNGAVTVLSGAPGPAVLTGDGKHVISVTETGLLLSDLRRVTGVARLYDIRPMLLADFHDPGSLAIVPTPDPQRFRIIAGCFGHALIASVRHLRPGPAQAELLRADTTGVMPYDNVSVAQPLTLATAWPQVYAFCTEWGRAALAAVDLVSGEVSGCPLPERDYGTIQRCLSRLDGQACLVTTKGGRLWQWQPHGTLIEITEMGGIPLLWQWGDVLVLDRDAGVLRQASTPVQDLDL